MTDILAQLAYLHGKPTAKAKLKAQPDHFIVKEKLGFEFKGTGEHLMVKIRKTGENTSFVANELAKLCKVKSKDVGWAGLKDRHAITDQWLSVYLPKSDHVDFSAFEKKYPSIQILETTRHNKKLHPGDLVGNEFQVTLSEVTDIESVEARINAIIQTGVPNYFGEQRFGRNGNNLIESKRWGRENVRTKNQNQRSLYLSTARSWIFNHIVSQRLEKNVLARLLIGDIVSQSKKHVEIDALNITSMQEELDAGNIELTAALAGDNALPTKGEPLVIEQAVVDAEPDLMALIRGNRMRHDRRNVTLKPSELSYHIENENVTLSFSLPSGCFATSIVRELVETIPVERKFD